MRRHVVEGLHGFGQAGSGAVGGDVERHVGRGSVLALDRQRERAVAGELHFRDVAGRGRHAGGIGHGVDGGGDVGGRAGGSDVDGLGLQAGDHHRAGGRACRAGRGTGGGCAGGRGRQLRAVVHGAEVARGGRDGLVGVGADLEGGRAEGAVQQFLAVEFCGAGDTVEFRQQLADFRLDGLAVARRIGGVGRLHRQFPHPLQDVSGARQRTFRHLGQRNAVVGVPRRLVHPPDLRGEALGDRQAGGIVLGAVDAQARGQALDGGVERRLAQAQVALGGERADVGVDGGRHGGTPARLGTNITAGSNATPPADFVGTMEGLLGSPPRGIGGIRRTKTAQSMCSCLKFSAGHPKTSPTGRMSSTRVGPPFNRWPARICELCGQAVPGPVGGNAISSQFFSGDLQWHPPSTPTSARLPPSAT